MTVQPTTKWICNRCKHERSASECALMRWETGHAEYICFQCNPDLQQTYDEAMRLIETVKPNSPEPSVVFEYVSDNK